MNTGELVIGSVVDVGDAVGVVMEIQGDDCRVGFDFEEGADPMWPIWPQRQVWIPARELVKSKGAENAPFA